MEYCKDFIARYISAENAEKIKEILRKLDELQIDYILEQIALLWEADSTQQTFINTLRTQINNVSLLYCTKEEYDSFSVKPSSTLYIVNNPDSTISLYAGENLITGGGGGGGDVSVIELTRQEYEDIEEHSNHVIYIVSEPDSTITIYIGIYQISGSGDISQLEQRVSAIENQITNVGLRSLTRQQYDDLQTHERDILYIVQETDLSIKLYVGDVLINEDGEGGGIILGIANTIINILGVVIGYVETGESGIASM